MGEKGSWGSIPTAAKQWNGKKPILAANHDVAEVVKTFDQGKSLF